MSSRLRRGMLTGMAVIALMLVSVIAYAGSVTYTYDSLNRLIKAEYEDGRVIQYTYDSAGNRTATYDSAMPPITTADPQGGTYNSAQSVTLTCTDMSGFGCDKIYYTTDGSTPITSSLVYSSPINISVTTTLKFFAKDLTGNSESVKTQTYIIIDTTPPTTTASPTGGTYGSAQSVTLSCTDGSGSGCDKIYYTTDGTTPTTSSSVYSSPIDISETATLKFFAKDLAGNSEMVKTQVYTIDTTPPTGTISIDSGAAFTDSVNVTLTLTCDDASGCSEMQFSNDNVNYSTPETYAATKPWTLTTGDGTRTVYAKFKDVVGNWSTSYSDAIELTTASYTKSLLHMDGADGSTTFTDSAAGGSHTWTRYGNAQIDTAQSKFGGASGLFDGNGDAITTPDAADLRMESGDFTIDFWVRYASGGSYHTIFDKGYTASGALLIQTDNSSSPKMRVYISGTQVCIESTGATTGAWHHYAVVRYGSGSNNVKIYRDGVATGQGTSTANINNTSGVAIGAKGGTYEYSLNGWLDEFRISKGIARWTSNFTPPSDEFGTVTINSGAAYTNNVNVTLTLTCTDAQGCSQMQFSNDNVNYSTPETYAATKAWTLTTGDGTKTVYAKFRDAGGNWSTFCSDSILLDTTPPTGTITIHSGAASANTDPYTKSLLHMDGADGSTTFTDSADGGIHTWTKYGNAQIDTAIAKFGSALLLDGNGDWIETPASNDFDFGSGEFTIDFWLNPVNPPSQLGGHMYIFFYGSDVSAGNWQWMIEINHNAGSDEHLLRAYVYDGAIRTITSNVPVSFGTWEHYALVREGNNLYMYRSGVKQTQSHEGLGTLTSPGGTPLFKIGDATWGSNHYYYQGSIDEVRVSKGIARWTANFIPPSAPYGSDFAVSLLHMNRTHGSTTFTDDAAGRTHEWTRYGDAHIDTAQSKFGGASGLFDGAGDYIQSADSEDWNFGSVDFTWDCQIRFNALPADGQMMVIEGTGDYLVSPYGGWNLVLYNNAGMYELRFYFWSGSGGVLATKVHPVSVSTGVWYHVAVIRNGNNLYISLDGTLSSPADWTGITQVDNNNTLRTGAKFSSASSNRIDFNGWLDERRISKGIAQWTSNFTPPSDEFGTVTIDSGAAFTNSVNVTVTLTCDDAEGCSQMKFSNDVDNESNYSTPETYAATKAWVLSSGDGNKSVYAEFKDVAGNWSTAFSSTILLDSTPPTTTASPTGGAYILDQSVALSCSDGTGSGCDKIYYTTDGTTPTTSSEVYSSSINISAATTLKFFARDLAGNSEAVKTQTYTVDTTPPTGTITVNAGAAFTNSPNVTLTLFCNDDNSCSQMQFSNDNVTYSAPETFATTKAWTLTSGDGTKTVYAKFKDTPGNWSSAYSNTILLDTTAPTTTASPAGGAYNSAQSVTLSCNDGSGSGCDKIYYTTDGTTPTTSSPVYSSSINISAATTLKFFARDLAGNSEAVKSETYATSTNMVTVQLKDSAGNPLSGGVVQYYSGGWQTFGTTDASGKVSKELQPGTYTFSMTYASARQEKSQNIATNPTVVFQTAKVTIQLKDSTGALIDSGSVQYYSGGWRDIGSTSGGQVTKELLPLTYTFSMTYGYARQEKSQNIAINSTVVFQTTKVTIELRDSSNILISDTGTVQYYSGGWRDIGTTSGGQVTKELLPLTYTFSMTYGYACQEKSQNIAINSTVVFQTTKVTIELRDSTNGLMDIGTVQYYSGGWRDIGSTSGGQVTKELLPLTYTFSMTYGFARQEKSQNVATNPTVVFQTTNVMIQLKDSTNSLMDIGTVQYYSGGWRDIGSTSGGQVTKELLPLTYTFSMTYGFARQEKSQNVATNPTVAFQTRKVTIELRDSTNSLIDTGTVQYYSGGWRDIGSTSGGQVTKELLPLTYTFSMTYGFARQEKSQNVATNPTVVFQTGQVHSDSVSCTHYYAGGWRVFIQDMELLPVTYTFRFDDGTPDTSYPITAGTVNHIH
jgi:YD repeat-containing protein